jgi:hypothetical protein
VPTGPDLSIDELTAIRIDQLKFTSGTAEASPEAAIYLRCKENDVYMACAGEKQGLSIVSRDGMSIGRLDVPFVAVDNVPAGESCLDVEVVWVEKNSADCPAAIDEDDVIAGVSADSPLLSLNRDGTGTLLRNKIISADGKNFIRFVTGPEDMLDLLDASAPVAEKALVLDQLWFSEPSIPNSGVTFKLMVNDRENTTGLSCEAVFDSSSGVKKTDLIYGGLKVPLTDGTGAPCTVTAGNGGTVVEITLTIKSTGNTTYTTSADSDITLDALVSKTSGRFKFEGDKAYVRFQAVEGM